METKLYRCEGMDSSHNTFTCYVVLPNSNVNKHIFTCVQKVVKKLLLEDQLKETVYINDTGNMVSVVLRTKDGSRVQFLVEDITGQLV